MPGPAYGWKKPANREEMLHVVKHLRDGLLHKYIFGLDRSAPYVIAFDHDGIDSYEDLRPVRIVWHSLDPRSVSWTEEYGSIGVGCLIKQRSSDPLQLIDAAMVQVGGVIVPKKDFASVNKKYAVVKSRHGVLVYLETKHFLTAPVLKQFATGELSSESVIKPQSYIKDARTLWHTVPEWVWKTVVSRMVRSHAPDPATLRRIRARELKKLNEGIDLSHSTSDSNDE